MLNAAALCDRIRPERIAQLTWELVNIPSPTGQATACTEYYADHLRSLGLDVAWETGHYPDQPSAVGRLPGGDGPTFQFDAHTDHVPLPHPAPVREDDRIIARGATDMKGSLAIMAEVAAVLAEADLELPGDLLLTAHDLHEAPGGLGETITDLCRRGIHGDAAIVCEGGRDVLPLVGRGMAIFEFHVRRDGELCHEVTGARNPIETATLAVASLYVERDRMALRPEPYVGPETIFVGQVHAGSFYNQVPNDVLVNGTWRFSPQKTFEQAQDELRRLLGTVPFRDGESFDLNFFQVRPSFALDPDEPVVKAVQAAYETVHGQPLPLDAAPAVCDTPVLVREAGIPTVGHGPVTHGAHGEPEWIAIVDQVATAKVYLHALEHYWRATAR